MEGGGTGRACPRPPPPALPPQGYSPLSSSRCGARPGPALAVLPLRRSSAPFWRPWVPAPGEVGRRTGTGSAAVSGKRGAAWGAERRGGAAAAGIALATSGEWRRGLLGVGLPEGRVPCRRADLCSLLPSLTAPAGWRKPLESWRSTRIPSDYFGPSQGAMITYIRKLKHF
ncbi:protein ripply2 isoform 1-T1 [Ciconia maguari]